MKKIKIETIIKTLEELYPNPSPPLDFKNDFELLIAVMLSAQTTDKKVNQVTPDLFKQAPDSFSMSKMTQSQIKNIIKEIGLSNTKARNLSKLSKILSEKYNGKVPHDFDKLIELPGVGEKTAQVFMIHGMKVPAFPVDTHILRLTQRFGISKEKTAPKCSALMKKLFPIDLWEKLHLQIIFFGREICTARNPKCPVCPMNSVCPSRIS